jgi:hypothetical protein
MEKSAEAIKILASLVSDLCTPILVLRDYDSRQEFHEEHKKVFKQGVYRLCLSAVIINMAKYVELWRKYSEIKRKHLAEHDKTINIYIEKIKNLGTISFRNDYIAHTQNDKEKRVLTDEEVDQYIFKITGGNAEDLFSWIYPKNYNDTDKNNSLVGIIMLSKDALMAAS